MKLPPHNNRFTSIEAAYAIAPNVTELAARVYHYLVEHNGATCWEIEQALNMAHQTASARLRELALRNAVEDSGERRKTGSGRNAIVWVKSEESRSVETAVKKKRETPTSYRLFE